MYVQIQPNSWSTQNVRCFLMCIKGNHKETGTKRSMIMFIMHADMACFNLILRNM